MSRKSWFNIEVKGEIAEVDILDEIGLWGVSAKDFASAWAATKAASRINLSVNSPGGDVFDGMAIYNLISADRTKVSVKVIGIAASIASVIALAGKTLEMAEGSYYMIHNPLAGVYGYAEDLRKVADTLDKIKESIVGVYVGRTGNEEAAISEMMDAETWMSAQEALDNGFATGVSQYADIAACSVDASRFGFHRVPEALLLNEALENEPFANERELERALRDSGLSRSVAMGIISRLPSLRDSGGRQDALRDSGVRKDVGDALSDLVSLMSEK